MTSIVIYYYFYWLNLDFVTNALLAYFLPGQLRPLVATQAASLYGLPQVLYSAAALCRPRRTATASARAAAALVRSAATAENLSFLRTALSSM
jgi:hypothetical protein